MLSYLVAALGLGLLIVLHEGGHFLVARLCGMRVERFSVFFGRPLIARKWGNTVYQIGWIPLGGYVQITGLNPHEEFDRNDPYVYPNRPRWMRVAVLAAGPAANYLTAVVLAIGILMGFGRPTDTLKIEGTVPDSPAVAAGLQAGDVLVEANGKKVSAAAPINDVISQSKGAPVTIKLLRGGSAREIVVTPKKDTPQADYRIGIRIGRVREPVSVVSGIKDGFVLPVTYSVGIANGLIDVIRGKQKAELTGPVGITGQMAKAAAAGLEPFLDIIMALSVYLGFFNLLPVPALDGARIVFVAVGALLRKDVNAKREATVHAVGLMVLLGVLVLVTFGDFKRIFMPQ